MGIGGTITPSQWLLDAGRGTSLVKMLICERCQNVLLFYEGNTLFDFD